MDDSDDEPPLASPIEGAAPRSNSSRLNKNRPPCSSSRRPVSTFRVAPGLQASAAASGRDPRFDPKGTAEFDEAGWRHAYDFIFERQREEAADMRRVLADSQRASKRGAKKRQRAGKKPLAPEEAAALRLELERTENRLAADKRRAQDREAQTASRREAKTAVEHGKRPFFEKRSEVRERKLLAQYEDLKQQGKLEKFLTKKRRKIDAKQTKRAPS